MKGTNDETYFVKKVWFSDISKARKVYYYLMTSSPIKKCIFMICQRERDKKSKREGDRRKND